MFMMTVIMIAWIISIIKRAKDTSNYAIIIVVCIIFGPLFGEILLATSSSKTNVTMNVV